MTDASALSSSLDGCCQDFVVSSGLQVHADGHVRDAAMKALQQAFRNILRTSGESLPELLAGLYWIPELRAIVQEVALTIAGLLRPQDIHQVSFVF